MSMPRWQRILRKTIFGCVLTGSLLALLYAEENWRAARDWSACEQALEARGELLDFSTHEGPPVPRERNLAFLPFFKHWDAYQVDPTTGRVVFLRQAPSPDFADLPHLKGGMLNRFPGVEKYDLSAWQRYFQHQSPGGEPLSPAPAVLRALERFQPLLAELAAARDAMPNGEFRREYDVQNVGENTSGGVPEIKLNYTLMLRASARLVTGHSSEAWQDIESSLWLQRATCGEPPTLLPLMVGIALLAQDSIPIKNGLASGGWTSDEIATLQAQLQRIDLLADYSHAMRGERDWVLGRIDAFVQILHHQALQSPTDDWRASVFNRLFFLVCTYGPRGWLIQNKVAASKWFQGCSSACDAPAHRLYPERQRAIERANQAGTSWPRPDNYLMQNLTFFLRAQLRVVADEQSQLDELVVACALKRYALAHDGRYPAALTELVPQFLDHVPTGLRDGQPMHYQTTAGGSYQLASGH